MPAPAVLAPVAAVPAPPLPLRCPRPPRWQPPPPPRPKQHLKKSEDLVNAIRRVADAASPIDDLRIKAGLAVVRDASYRPARQVDCVTE